MLVGDEFEVGVDGARWGCGLFAVDAVVGWRCGLFLGIGFGGFAADFAEVEDIGFVVFHVAEGVALADRDFDRGENDDRAANDDDEMAFRHDEPQ